MHSVTDTGVSKAGFPLLKPRRSPPLYPGGTPVEIREVAYLKVAMLACCPARPIGSPRCPVKHSWRSEREETGRIDTDVGTSFALARKRTIYIPWEVRFRAVLRSTTVRYGTITMVGQQRELEPTASYGMPFIARGQVPSSTTVGILHRGWE